MNSIPPQRHMPVIIVGGGQSGLSMSWHLSQRGIAHLLLERRELGHSWRRERWDTFCLVTPNWQCQLPDYPYAGPDPHGFMLREEIVAYMDGFVARARPPAREGVEVRALRQREGGGFHLVTSDGEYTADQVVVATGGYHDPIVPDHAMGLAPEIVQVTAATYRTPSALPEGAVLVVGTGQSGCQIAEDLHLAGRPVHLCVGDAPRVARRYRGRDVVEWLHLMGYYDLPVERHPLREGVRDNTNHYVTGRDGGRDIDLRRHALGGMRLYGRLEGVRDGILLFGEGLRDKLDAADAVRERINRSIDEYIARTGVEAPAEAPYAPPWQPEEEPRALDYRAAGITSVVWCIGFRSNFRWLGVPVFDGGGRPVHHRGVTSTPGLYFLGLPWLHTWGSGRFSGVARDAAWLAEKIVALAETAPAA
jgi:putative flavoprotein involved in K+ transport